MTKETFRSRRPGFIGADSYKRYAVLVPILQKDGVPSLLFERRAETLHRQPGEICFPGGRIEPPETPEECAIRETREELLIPREDIEIYGPGDLFLSPFNFIIHPFIGRLKRYDGRFNEAEVAETFTVPIDFFRTHPPETYTCPVESVPREDFPYERIPGGQHYNWHKGVQEILFYQVDEDHLIWGITAQIVRSAVGLIDRYSLA